MCAMLLRRSAVRLAKPAVSRAGVMPAVSVNARWVSDVTGHAPSSSNFAPIPVSATASEFDTYGTDCFNQKARKKYLPKAVYQEFEECLQKGKMINPELADRVAAGVLRWAEERGVTHYSHWFHPMTGGFAYKHDALVKRDGLDVVTNFTGKMLIQAEPDGSSFPNGGLRATHLARGYTVWDPSSPLFILNHGTGSTLCIPSVFFSWGGAALDEKIPLLRATEALNKAGVRLLRAAGFTGHTRLTADSGVEQEFFMIDKEYFDRRTDLVQTGRTLIGADPPKGQTLEDQYFGSFSDRALKAMNDAERALWRLGIPQTTRHREVAPGQYEMAPVFSACNQASDNNILAMDVLQKVANRHDLAVLFHEKPFANLNGSGKHNNWSVGTNKIGTVFDGGAEPEKNIMFMTFLAATIRSCHLHGDVLRFSVASAGNDHRLGANEAPPAIMSVYLGEALSAAVERFLNQSDVRAEEHPGHGDVRVTALPKFKIDATDRNRTSPIAFTGNKFEFRAVGASQTPARSCTALNTIMTDSLEYLTEELIKVTGGKPATREQLEGVLRETIRKHKAVLFDGNGYSNEWREEAARRGLSNFPDTPSAIKGFNVRKNYDLYAKHGVLSNEELEARVNIAQEEYVKKLTTEARSIVNLVNTVVLPTGYNLQARLAGAMIASKSAGVNTGSGQQGHLTRVSGVIDRLCAASSALEQGAKDVPHHGDLQDSAEYCRDKLKPLMAAARAASDELETLCDRSEWPLPTYHEMLFHQD